MPTLSAEIEAWPIDGEFVISRGAKREASVVVATVTSGAYVGRGECVPYERYGETPESVLADILAVPEAVEDWSSREALADKLPAGAARNAIDCALWDLDAKMNRCPAHVLAGIANWRDIVSAYTISLGPPEEMAARAKWAGAFPLLKLKMGGEGDAERLRAVRGAVPGARLIVDANEAWSESNLEALLAVAKEVGAELVEQPLPAGSDAALADVDHVVALCADESVHTVDDIPGLAGRYDVVNIKLDKAGGLTGALRVADAAKTHELKIMVGCMVATSLSMAPAMLLAQTANWVDLDGPLLLAHDRIPGLRYNGTTIQPPKPELWG